MYFSKIVSAIAIISLSSHGVQSCDLNLPTVDLTDPNAAENLVDAFQSYGFSYITGHKISKSIVKDAEKQAKNFFRLPSRVKRQLEADRSRNVGSKTYRGFTSVRNEQLDNSERGRPDLKEVLDIGFVNSTSRNKRSNKRHYLGENKWPSKNKYLQESIENYAENSARVAQKVLQLLAQGLGATGAFDDAFNEDALQVQRLTKYPASNSIEDREQGEIGSGIHSDYGGITVLHGDGPGLYVLRPNMSSLEVDSGTFSPELKVPHSNEWIEVESQPGTFIVMGGEALQRLSNGLIFAAKHKVELPSDNEERHSLAFFFDPRPDAILEPLKVFQNNEKPLYGAKLAGHKGIKKH